MNQFYEEYLFCKNRPSDINEHLESLYNLAKEVNSITEFGIGLAGNSTTAFIAAVSETGGKFRSYDLKIPDHITIIANQAKQSGFDVKLIIASDLEIDIEETDILFIDSYHTYNQMKAELERHGNKVKKYIAFHDTVGWGMIGEHGSIGIKPAIDEWMNIHPEWKIKEDYQHNNGLLILIKDDNLNIK